MPVKTWAEIDELKAQRYAAMVQSKQSFDAYIAAREVSERDTAIYHKLDKQDISYVVLCELFIHIASSM